MRRVTSFRDLLEQSRRPLGRTLLEKADLANKLAKQCKGASKRQLYKVKHRHLSRAIEIMPNSFHLDSVVETTAGMILGVRSFEGLAFHIPEQQLSAKARIHITSAKARMEVRLGREIQQARHIAAA